jgi:hypothetical protein
MDRISAQSYGKIWSFCLLFLFSIESHTSLVYHLFA